MFIYQILYQVSQTVASHSSRKILKYFDKESEERIILRRDKVSFYKFSFRKKGERNGSFYSDEREAKLPGLFA